MTERRPRRTAVVTDWITVRGGAARVLESVLDSRPDADVHTLVYDAEAMADSVIGARHVSTSPLQRLPLVRRYYRACLPLMPLAVERLDMRPYDLILSFSHAVASGVLTGADQLHVGYVFTPVRYGWDLQRDYLESSRRVRLLTPVLHPLMHYLRLWDLASSRRPDVMVAASHYIARRIAKVYGRSAEVIHPPVDVGRFDPTGPREDFYLTVSRLVPYKRVDLLAEAFSRLGRRLVIIGDGPERARVERAAGPSVTCLGWQPDAVVTSHLERCRAFVFAADEDFGIAPVEAMAAGAPVIAFRRGGVTETVTDGETGLFFDEQDAASVAGAVDAFERASHRFAAARLRAAAEAYSPVVFEDRFNRLVERAWDDFERRRQGRGADATTAVGG